jgi:hypothetical protein
MLQLSLISIGSGKNAHKGNADVQFISKYKHYFNNGGASGRRHIGAGKLPEGHLRQEDTARQKEIKDRQIDS